MEKFSTRHGGPYDRGASDSHYCRPFRPHFFKGATYQSEEITEENMSSYELKAYRAGYEDNEASGNFKY